LVFTGTYAHTIDAKNRVAIPANIRARILEEAGTRAGEPVLLYVTMGENGALCIYTRAMFEKRSLELEQSELDATELLPYERLWFSLSRDVELDEQGRVRLPEHLLELSKVGTDVVLLGVKDHLEIRDRKTWMEHLQKTLTETPQLLMNPRQAMRKPKKNEANAS